MPTSQRLLRSKTFTPASIPGLSLWLDPSRLDSLTLNDTTVSEIRDLSGNDRHFSQTTALSQPLLSDVTMPSGRVSKALFFGGSQFMEGNAAAMSQFTGDHLYAFSMSAAVHINGGLAGTNGILYTTSVSSSNTTNRISFQARSINGVVAMSSRILDSDSLYVSSLLSASFPTQLFVTGSFFVTSQWIPEESLRRIVVRGYSRESTSSGYAVGSGGSGTTSQAPSLLTRLGANLQTNRFYGYLCEFATYKRKLELQEIDALASYYKAKWETV